MSADEVAAKLKRRVGLVSAFCLIINSIMGAGIFVSPEAVLFYSGSVGLSLIIWTVAGIITLLSAVCYAELATVVPRSGSDFTFLITGLGPLHKFWGPLASFTYVFLNFVLLRPVGSAVLLMVSANYTFALITSYVCIEATYLNWAKMITTFLYLFIISYINMRTVWLYLKVQNILTALKLTVALILIGTGVYQLAIGNNEFISTGFEGSTVSPKNIALGIYNGAYAFGGWVYIISITEEVKNPKRNILLTLLLGVPFIIVVYLFLNVSYMTVLSKDEIINSSAVAVSFMAKAFPVLNPVVALGIAISTFGSSLTHQFSGSRIFYAAAQEGHLMPFISFLHVTRLTPSVSVAISAFLTAVVLVYTQIRVLIEFLVFVNWLIGSATVFTIFIFRKTRKDAPRPLKVPICLPVLLIAVEMILFFTPLVTNPHWNYFIALGVVLIGCIVYYIFVYKKIHWSYYDKITYFVQVLFEVVPSEIQDLESLKEQKAEISTK